MKETFREASEVVALNAFFEMADSTTVQYIGSITEKAPALMKLFDSLAGKSQLVAKLSGEAQQKLASGEWHWLFAKDGSGMLPSLKDASGHFAEQIRIGEVTVNPAMLDSIVGLTLQNSLAALNEKVAHLTQIAERIIVGQYNDRIAMYYSARQTYIEAMSMNDLDNRKIALLNAAKLANESIATLQITIRSDLHGLRRTQNARIFGGWRNNPEFYVNLRHILHISPQNAKPANRKSSPKLR